MSETFEKRDEVLKLLDEYCDTCCGRRDCFGCSIAKAYDKIMYGDSDDKAVADFFEKNFPKAVEKPGEMCVFD